MACGKADGSPAGVILTLDPGKPIEYFYCSVTQLKLRNKPKYTIDVAAPMEAKIISESYLVFRNVATQVSKK